MADRLCNNYQDERCVLGLENFHPSEEFCASCKHYDGPDRGFGDKVAKIVKATRIDKLMPNGCGCGKRRAALNKRFPKDTSDA